ncbi:MAG: DUF1573 domain-containing protein [Pirellulales bacterium]|nr:DUF1573 domain-containing protein [Pirellulales bacterium]
MIGRSVAIAVGVALLGGALPIGMAVLRTGAEPAADAQPGNDAQPGASAGAPRAVVNHAVHDFGVVDADQDCEHTFVIRNAGAAALTLRSRESSCKCVVSQLPARVLKPNQSTEVRIVAHARDRSGSFADRVEIETNDPNQPALAFEVRGVIRTFLGSDPPRVTWTDLCSSKAATAEVVVFSQTWDSFAIEGIEPSLDRVQWEVAPAPAGRLDELDARCGYLVKLTVPAGAIGSTDARFYATIHLRAAPADKPQSPRSLQIVLSGTTRQNVSLFGRKIDGRGALKLGVVHGGAPVRERVVLRMRDVHAPVAIRSIETEPDFLRARVLPQGGGAARAGLIHLDVEIPAGAPAGNHMGSNKGAVRLLTDHPDLPMLGFDVDFAILDADAGPSPR